MNAQHLRAVPLAHRHDAVVGDRGRIRTGKRTGQRETGHLAAIGQARQVVALLFLGAEALDRLGDADGLVARQQRRQRRPQLAGTTDAAAAVALRPAEREIIVALR